VPRAWPCPQSQHLPQLRGNTPRVVISKQLSAPGLRPSTLEFTQSLSIFRIFSNRDYLIVVPELICDSTAIGLLLTDPTLAFSQFRGRLSDPVWLLPSRADPACKSLYQLIEGAADIHPPNSYLIVAETIIKTMYNRARRRNNPCKIYNRGVVNCPTRRSS
jgi:hypothetical protein